MGGNLIFGYAYLKAYVESAKPKLEIYKNKIDPTKATEKKRRKSGFATDYNQNLFALQVAIKDERNKTEKPLSG